MIYALREALDLRKLTLSMICTCTSWTLSSFSWAGRVLSRINDAYSGGREMIDNTDEKDIELMFAEARRYDLLTAEQEQTITTAKWAAVR